MGSNKPTDVEETRAFDDELEEKIELLNAVEDELALHVSLLSLPSSASCASERQK